MASDLLARIKELPTSQIISAYFPLQNKGRDHVGMCPFHDDHSPSMHVNDSKGIFKCFACDAGGDAISFVQRYKSLDFREALIDIAEKFSLPVDEFKNPKKANPKFEMAEKILKVANKIYKKTVSDANPEQFKDFLKNRELSEEVSEKFSLGYAPGSNALSSYLKSLDSQSQKMALDVAMEIGIIRKSTKQGQDYYDTFRDRITFPIWDQFSNIVGYGTRAVFDYQKGKYVNSQDSFVFNKRNILYGLNFAKSSIREKSQVILVEGYMDCIALAKNGFENTVAVMGVAISDKNVTILKSMAKEVFLALDSDNAGFNACKRINEQFLKQGIIPKWLNFGEYKDPDEYLTHRSRIDLDELITIAPAFIDVQVEQLFQENSTEDTDQKVTLLNESFKILSPLGKGLLATERAIQWAKKLQMNSTNDQILEAYTNFINPQTNNFQQALQPKASSNAPLEIKRIEVKFSLTKAERKLVTLMAQHPESFNVSSFKTLLDNVTHPEVKRTFDVIQNIYLETDEQEYPRLLSDVLKLENLELEIQEVVASGLYHYSGKELEQEKIEKMIADLDRTLKREILTSRKKELLDLKTKDQSDSFEILKEIHQIQSELNRLN